MECQMAWNGFFWRNSTHSTTGLRQYHLAEGIRAPLAHCRDKAPGARAERTTLIALVRIEDVESICLSNCWAGERKCSEAYKSKFLEAHWLTLLVPTDLSMIDKSNQESLVFDAGLSRGQGPTPIIQQH